MEYKVFVFSDKVLNGQIKFNYDLFNHICLYNLIDVKAIYVENFDLKRDFILGEENLIIFCENQNLDNLIIEHIQKLGSKKTFIDEQLVVFDRAGRKVIFVPLEVDYNLLNKALTNNENRKICEFHIFGLSQEQVLSRLESLKTQIENFSYKISYDNLLCDIVVSYDWQESLLDDNMAKIVSEFKQNIYSENKMSLPEIVIKMLKLKEQKLAVCENITQGLITSNLLNYDDELTVIKRASFEKFDFNNNDALYDKTLNYLKESQSDLAVVTNGKFVDNALEFTFAIADKNEVHIYKNLFKASKEASKQMAKNALLFHLTKKLRQNEITY